MKSAATSFGTFVFNQHPSPLLHKVLCHRWRPTCSGARHHVVGPGSMSVVSGTGSTQLERPADVLCCVPCSALLRSCHDTWHWHTWHTGSLALELRTRSTSTQTALPANQLGLAGVCSSNIPSSIGSQAKMVPCLGRHAPPPCLLPDRLGPSHRGRDGDGSAWWLLGSQEVFRCPS